MSYPLFGQSEVHLIMNVIRNKKIYRAIIQSRYLNISELQQFRVAGIREMIREAGSDFREVFPGQKNFMWENGRNIY